MSAMRPGEQGRGQVLYQVRRVTRAAGPGGGDISCGGALSTTSRRGAAAAAGSPCTGPTCGPGTAATCTTLYASRAAGPADLSATTRTGTLRRPTGYGLRGGAGLRHAYQDQGRRLLDRRVHRRDSGDTGVDVHLHAVDKRPAWIWIHQRLGYKRYHEQRVLRLRRRLSYLYRVDLSHTRWSYRVDRCACPSLSQ